MQRDIEESVRTRVFAWSETVLQIAWVIGGGIGIALPLVPQLGFGVISGLLLLVLAASVRIRMSRTADHPVRPTWPRPRSMRPRADARRVHPARAQVADQRVRSILVLPSVLGLTRSRSRNSATPSS